MSENPTECRLFVSQTAVKLPLTDQCILTSANSAMIYKDREVR